MKIRFRNESYEVINQGQTILVTTDLQEALDYGGAEEVDEEIVLNPPSLSTEEDLDFDLV